MFQVALPKQCKPMGNAENCTPHVGGDCSWEQEHLHELSCCFGPLSVLRPVGSVAAKVRAQLEQMARSSDPRAVKQFHNESLLMWQFGDLASPVLAPPSAL